MSLTELLERDSDAPAESAWLDLTETSGMRDEAAIRRALAAPEKPAFIPQG